MNKIKQYNLISRCESIIDSCSNNPCVKGVCVSMNTTYKCFCYTNYTGKSINKQKLFLSIFVFFLKLKVPVVRSTYPQTSAKRVYV